jgi:type II secretory pathway pseudopilin PulG
MRKGGDEGESLVEIVVSLVLLGTVVAALMAGLATAARVSAMHRNNVTADTVIRSYAEQVKNAVRTQCTTKLSYLLPLTPVDGFTPSQEPPAQSCPTAASNIILTLKVDGKGLNKKMQLEVRRP